MTLPLVSLTIALKAKLSGWGVRAPANQAQANSLMPLIGPQAGEEKMTDTNTEEKRGIGKVDRLMRRYSQTSVSDGDRYKTPSWKTREVVRGALEGLEPVLDG